MPQASPNFDLTPQDPLDRRVDTEQISYSQAMYKEGIPIPDLREFSADAIRARLKASEAREADSAYYAEEFGLSGAMSPDEATKQQAINARRPAMPWEKPKGA